MYLWLFVVVGLIWLFLVGGSFSAWRQRQVGGFVSTLSMLFWTGAAAGVILFAAPYWSVVYRVLLQPG